MASLLSPLPHTDSHTAAARAGADPASTETTAHNRCNHAAALPKNPKPPLVCPPERDVEESSHSITADNSIKTKFGALLA